MTEEQEQLKEIGHEILDKFEAIGRGLEALRGHMDRLEVAIESQGERIAALEMDHRMMDRSHTRVLIRLASLEYRVDPSIVTDREFPPGTTVIFAEEKDK